MTLPDGWHGPGPDHPCAVCQYDARGNPTAVDDHPKLLTDIAWRNPQTGVVHGYPDPETGRLRGNALFHFDCLPPDVLFQHYSDESNPHVEHTLAVREEAQSGTHGHDLRVFMLRLGEERHAAFLAHHAGETVED